MIRVLHIIDTTGPGGAETVFIKLAKGLDPKRFESVVAIRGPGWVCDTLHKYHIEPLFIESEGGFNLKYLADLVHIIYEYKIDVIQSHLLGSNLYSSMAGLFCRVPVISTIHGFVDANEKERLMWIKARLINMGSKKIVFVSDRLREHYIKDLGFSSQKSLTIYNGVDTSVFFPKKDDSIGARLGINNEHVLIGAVGNIRPAKGYDIFLRTARLVIDQYPNSRFIVAGQGSGKLFDELIELRNALGLEEVFHFIGFQSDTAKIFNNLDIFVLPSISEGFSLATIEAIACGLPVIVTKSGGPEEIVYNQQNCLIVAVSPDAIADAIFHFMLSRLNIKNSELYPAQDIVNNYCLDLMITKYQELFI